MGSCKYCGMPAGFLRESHKECRDRRTDTAERISEFFSKALHSPMEPEKFRALVRQIAAENFISPDELQTVAVGGISRMIDAAYADEHLADDEDRRITALISEFGFSANDLGYAGMRVAKSQLLRKLESGSIPTNIRIDAGPINLERNETALWLFNDATYYKIRSKTRYVGGSQGVSIRVMKGVYYRVGSYKGEPVRTEYMSEEGSGVIVLGSRNFYFWSPDAAVKVPLKKIMSVYPYSDGIQIMRSSANAVPQIFKLDDPPFACDVIARASQLNGG